MDRKSHSPEITEALRSLEEAVQEIILYFKKKKNTSFLVTPLWTAKDVLGHLTFWHESFANNLQDAAVGKAPNPLKGKLSEVNLASVETTRPYEVEELLSRMEKAQITIRTYIHHPDLTLIPYKKGSRPYPPLEHLEVVNKHIHKHLKAIQKKEPSHAQT